MLFIIDMQNKFLDPTNIDNYEDNAKELSSGIINKARNYKEKGDKIFYTQYIQLQSAIMGGDINTNDDINIKKGEFKSIEK